jgi:hypothetical protein
MPRDELEAVCSEYSTYLYRPFFAEELYQLPVVPGSLGVPYYRNVDLDEDMFNCVTKKEFADYIDYVAELLYSSFEERYTMLAKVLESVRAGKSLSLADKFVIDELENDTRSRLFSWEKFNYKSGPANHLYSLTNANEPITAHNLEYSFFNLIYTYHTFDWANDDLVVSGW